MTRNAALETLETARAQLVTAARAYRKAMAAVEAAEAAELEASDEDEGVDYTSIWAGEYELLADSAIDMQRKPLARVK